MNAIRKYFTLKKIFIFFAIFVVLFSAADLTPFIDWQYYKAEYVNNKCSGIYIYDKDLYKEAKEFGDTGIKVTLSNGFPTQREPLYEDPEYYRYGQRFHTQDSRIRFRGSNIFYIDDSGNKHTIYQIREYFYEYFKIYISGDEGNGWRLNLSDLIWFSNKNNIFYIEEYNDSLKGICE